MSIRIRIKQKSLESYTGNIGIVEFKNGLSVGQVSIPEAMRIGASMPIEDEDGVEISPVTYYSHIAQKKAAKVDSNTDSQLSKNDSEGKLPDESVSETGLEQKGETATGDSVELEQKDEQKPEGENVQVEGTDDQEQVSFTREQLEKVADEEGISGLRKIATPLGVGAKSIEDLINKLLEL